MKRLLDRIPLGLLTLLALWMAVAPIAPQPHLWEKLQMLAAGSLTRPLDIFDLILHATPLTLLLAKLYFRIVQRPPPG